MDDLFQNIAKNIERWWNDARNMTPPSYDDPLPVEAQYLNKGHNYFRAKLYEPAKLCYTAALLLAPDDIEALRWRAYCNFNLGLYDEAIADCNRVLFSIPHDSRLLSLRGRSFGQLGQLHSAVRDFEWATHLYPHDDRLKEYLALYLHEIAPDRAVKVYTKLLDEAHNDAQKRRYRLNRAYCYYSSQQFDEALEDYAVLLDADEKDRQALSGRAHTHILRKDYASALKDYRNLSRMEPENGDYLHNIAWILAETGEIADAMRMAEKALAQKPYDFHIHNMLGWWYPHLDQLDMAMKHAQRACEIGANTAYAFDTRAQIHWLKGDYQAALDDYDTAIHFHDLPLYHASKALTLDAMGREKEAINLWREAVEKDDKLTDVEATFAQTFHHAPKFVQAMKNFAEKVERQ